MTKPQLTVDLLIKGGFKEAGCWELNSVRDLAHSIDLPKTAGVYAFLIDGVAQYVGLASKSLHQRLGFYRKPGATQRTNIRLNEVIRGHLTTGTLVHIYVAQPPDAKWGDFTIKGPEGLEAGLIERFDLPWNMRGTVRAVEVKKAPATSGQTAVADQIVTLVHRRPGMTELEIAKAIYGAQAVQPQVNQHCRMLVGKGLIERHGLGGPANPFVYRPKLDHSR